LDKEGKREGEVIDEEQSKQAINTMFYATFLLRTLGRHEQL
jgi:hypothetical protein